MEDVKFKEPNLSVTYSISKNPDSLLNKAVESIGMGYSSNATFTRAFHSITGMTPKEYRDCPCFHQKLG